MDAGIILGGQTPDILGAMDRGRAAAENQINLNRQNALAELYRTQGAQIAAGDQGALNALAQFDPNAALGVQNSLLGMDATRQEMAFSAERMQMARDEGKRMAEESLRANADKVTADQLAAEREAITKGLSGAAFFYQNKDKAGYEKFLSENGMDPAQFPFEEFPAHAAMFEGALEAMNTFAPPEPAKPADDYQRYVAEETAAGRQPMTRIEFANALKGNGVTQTITNPDGTTTTIQVGGAAGAAGSGKPLTEAQAKLVVFQTDMEQAAQVMDEMETRFDPTNMQDAVADSLGGKWGSFFQTAEGQIYKSAALQWIDSGLRIRTGAASTEGEVARQFAALFPQPGDKPETVEYKRRARQNFQRAVDEALRGVRDPKTPEAPEDPLKAAETGKSPMDMSDDEFLKSLGLE